MRFNIIPIALRTPALPRNVQKADKNSIANYNRLLFQYCKRCNCTFTPVRLTIECVKIKLHADYWIFKQRIFIRYESNVSWTQISRQIIMQHE